jgi:hypothetical protein
MPESLRKYVVGLLYLHESDIGPKLVLDSGSCSGKFDGFTEPQHSLVALENPPFSG